MLNPHQAKLRIVVLGNYNDRLWSKLDKYALVLSPDTLHLIVSMGVEWRGLLQQGDCKNAFCQGILPPDKITIVKPPISNQDAKKDKYWPLKCTLYGLHCSPRHWYDNVKKVLQHLAGLCQNFYDPAYSPATSSTRMILRFHPHWNHSPLASTLRTLSTFWPIPPSKLGSNNF
jgi:hypothetical protein